MRLQNRAAEKSRSHATPKKSGKAVTPPKKAAAKKIAAPKKAAAAKKNGAAAKPLVAKPAAKPAVKPAPAKAAAPKTVTAPVAAAKPVEPPKPAAKPPVAPPPSAAAPAAKPITPRPASPMPQSAQPKPNVPPRPMTAQQADERRKAVTRKLFARIRSLEAIVGADLRKRGSLLLAQAVDQWYAEVISASATDVTITSAARAVISQL